MHGELAAEKLPVAVEILGINPAAHESGNAEMCEGKDLPWLQENTEVSVWSAWSVTS
jgi:hypothetical protein